MIALALAMAASTGEPDNKAADWACASPLIEKNFNQPVDSRQLALRIMDECAKPFVPSTSGPNRDAHNRIDAHLRQTEKLTFMYEIEIEIMRLRRARSIPLKR